ncbi:MAG: hypothetical protein KBS52_03240 [Clostridiales bacterium]|nr:hypothetical protein [Candidatus Equinaster intestinalis]
MNRDNVTKARVIVWFILAALWIALTVLQFITGENLTTAIFYCAAAVAISGAAITTYLRYRNLKRNEAEENSPENTEDK